MVAAIGEASEETFRPEIHVDDFEVLSEGDSSVRLIHASLDAPAVDVTVAGSGAVLSDNLTFSNASTSRFRKERTRWKSGPRPTTNRVTPPSTSSWLSTRAVR